MTGAPRTAVVVDPRSTGPELVRALQEGGAEVLSVWEPLHLEHYRRDAVSDRTLLHESEDRTLRVLAAADPVAVLPGCEYGVRLAERLAERLGLPTNPPELAEARRDKQQMLAAVRGAGLAAVSTVRVRSPADLHREFDRAGGDPFILKPATSSGGDGIVLCRTAAEAEAVLRREHNQHNLLGECNDGVLLQPYVAGPQYAVNTVSIDGSHLLADLSYQHYEVAGGSRLRSRHLRTVTEPSRAESEVVSYALACLDAVGMANGAAHTEVRMTADGPTLIEVNCRLMGPSIEPDPYHLAFGYTQQHLTAERYLQPESFRARLEKDYGPRRLLARSYLRVARTGRIAAIRNLNMVRDLYGFHSLHDLARPGRQVADPFFVLGGAGHAYFVADDVDLLDAALGELHHMEDQGRLVVLEPDDGARGA